MEIIKWICENEITNNMEHTDSEEYYDILEEEIIKNRYAFSGEFVQESEECCVPVFDDGKFINVSWRTWGAIMASAWNKIMGEEKYTYLDFYMDCYMEKHSEVQLHYPQGED